MAGSITSPFSLTQALVNGNIQPGHTIYLRGGYYSAIPYRLYIYGTAENPVTIKAYPGERPIILGKVNVWQSYTIWEGIEFYSPIFSPRNAQLGIITATNGLDVNQNGAYTKLRGCIIHDFLTGIGSSVANIEINGCAIFNIGYDDSDRGHGHGVYVNGINALLKNNIVFNTFGWTLHAYREDGLNIDDCVMDGNICFNSSIYSTVTKGPNIFLGVSLGLVNRGIIKNNNTYHAEVGGNYHGYGLMLGYNGANLSAVDCQVFDNYLAGGSYSAVLKPQQNLDMHDNTLIGPIDGFASGDYADNTYLDAMPVSGSRVVVYPLDWITTKAHVVVYNWESANTVVVDLTSVTGLSVGDSVLARNVQDYFIDTQTLVLDASKHITVNMQAASRSVKAPVNWTATTTTFPVFGAFVVEKA